MSRSLRAVVLAALAAVSLASAACGSDDGNPAGSAPTSAKAGVSGGITVFAAASLTESFDAIGRRFQEENPDAKVTFDYAGSSALSKQINDGAPADVFASAAPKNMDEVVDAGNASEPTDFVSNTLMIAVPKGNPGGIRSLDDFADASKKIALCAPEVPCGAAAEKVFEAAGITPQPDTLEQDVKAVLTKVRLGEVDAALVYQTDVNSGGEEVEGIEFPEAADAVNVYPIAVLKDAPNPEGAEAFVDFVLSDEGQAVLTEAGFDKP
ncbi:MAG TPA: molybdate ABC transporter substrate-binding protein [Actinophytocola sp.]|jgi:molybdate transport system substrate-binding protein|uniref:molybdate ABC transporter substrate-binding protein n=1 Tax=Actinophytocola sp. TaxID=1872138 RepID=UPI002F9339E7